MARTIEKLKALQVTREDRPGRYPDGGGLYLQISPSGSKSWVFRYRSNGHLSTAGKPLSREMGIGSVHDVSLSEARQRAQEARRKLQDGIDPIQDRQTKRAATEAARSKAMTFAEAARKCIASKRAGWKSEKHASQWENTLLGDATLHLQKMAVSAITTADVMLVLQPLWTRIPETADRMRNRIEAVLDQARTAPAGKSTSISCYLGNPMFARSSTTQRYRLPKCRSSLSGFVCKRASARARLNGRSLRLPGPGRPLRRNWTRLIGSNVFGPCPARE
jgi:Arm DNA-binding domain